MYDVATGVVMFRIGWIGLVGFLGACGDGKTDGADLVCGEGTEASDGVCLPIEGDLDEGTDDGSDEGADEDAEACSRGIA